MQKLIEVKEKILFLIEQSCGPLSIVLATLPKMVSIFLVESPISTFFIVILNYKHCHKPLK